jgi:hypothetical protein
MKPRRSVVKSFLAAFAVGLFLIPIAASADESWDVAHCKAAVETNDWPSATVYCTSAAEDYSVDASRDKGYARAVDLTLEGTVMGEIGFAYHEMGKADDSADSYIGAGRAYGAARRILAEAQRAAKDPHLLETIRNALNSINQQWPQ